MDLKEKYPECVPKFTPQLKGESWAAASAFNYSFRNCIAQVQNGNPPKSTDNVNTDPNKILKCGSSDDGYSDSVSCLSQIEHNNPVRKFYERDIDQELEKHGSVVATFMYTDVCVNILCEKFCEITYHRCCIYKTTIYYMIHRILNNV